MAITEMELDQTIYEIVRQGCDRGNITRNKAMDVQKKVLEMHPDLDKNAVKFSIKRLVDGGRLVYIYVGGSFLVTDEWVERQQI